MLMVSVPYNIAKINKKIIMDFRDILENLLFPQHSAMNLSFHNSANNAFDYTTQKNK